MGKIKGGWKKKNKKIKKKIKYKKKKKKVAGCSPSRILQVIYIVRIFELLSSSADGRRLIIMQMTLVRGNANGCVRWIAMEASPSTGHFACICKSTRAILFVC